MGSNYDSALSMEEKISPASPQFEPDKPTLTITGSRSEGPIQNLQVVSRERYLLQGVVAEGGQGRILRAKDLQLGRTIAVKELHKPGGDTEARFLREARITARLQHPAIVPIYEAGRWPSGEPFYAMKLVSGRTLARLIESLHSLSERLAALPHVLAAAEAIAYAHSQRVIHRDLKPANVLVGEFGETVVVDWGLGKELDGPETSPDSGTGSSAIESERTQEGTVMGTPAYLPPEQAAGKPVDERADVYALGAILYELLSGQPPYRGTSVREVLQQALTREPTQLARLQPQVPEELLTIVSRAMKREPAQRYPSARELAEDLRRFLTGQLVGAHTYSGWQLLRRFFRQYRAPLRVATVALAALVMGGVFDYQRIRHERDRAEEKQAIAERAEREARHAENLRAKAESEATRRADALTLAETRNALARSPEEVLSLLDSLSPSFPQWGQIRTLAADAISNGLPKRLSSRASHANFVQFSPDGRWLLTRHADYSVRLTDIQTDTERMLVPPAIRDGKSDFRLISIFSPDGKCVAFTSPQGPVKLMDLTTGSSRDLTGHTVAVTSLAFLPDGHSLISAGLDGQIRLSDVTTGTSRLIGSSRGKVFQLRVLPNGEHVVTQETQDRVSIARLWNLKDGSSRLLSTEPQHVNCLGSASQAGSFAIGTAQGDVYLWESVDGRKRTLANNLSSLLSVALSPDGRMLAAGADTVKIWNLKDGTSQTPELRLRMVDALAFSPNGQWLAIAGDDGQAQLLEVASGASRLLPKTSGPLRSVAFSPDGEWLATINGAGTVHLHRVKENEPSSRIVAQHEKAATVPTSASAKPPTALEPDESFRRRVTAFALTPDGSHVLSAGKSDNKVRLSSLKGESVVESLAHPGGMVAASILPDGSRLVTAGADGMVALWNESGQLLRRFSGPAQPLRVVALNASGTWIAGGDISGGVWLWDVASGQRRTLDLREAPVRTLAFSPDGRYLASGGVQGELHLWEVASGVGRTVHRDRASLGLIAFSADGSLLATSSMDGTWLHPLNGGASHKLSPNLAYTVLFSADGRTLFIADIIGPIALWDVPSGRLLSHLQGDRFIYMAMALSPEGHRLAAARSDGSVRLWDLPSGESRVLLGHKGPATGVAFSPTGRVFVSSGVDGTVRLWKDALPLEPEALRQWVHQAANP